MIGGYPPQGYGSSGSTAATAKRIRIGHYGGIGMHNNAPWELEVAKKAAASAIEWFWCAPWYEGGNYNHDMSPMGAILKAAGKKIILRTMFMDDAAVVAGGWADFDLMFAGGAPAISAAVVAVENQITRIGYDNLYAITLQEEEPTISGGTEAHFISVHNSIAAALRVSHPTIKIFGAPINSMSQANIESLDIDGLFWYKYDTCNAAVDAVTRAAMVTFFDLGLTIATNMGFGADYLYALTSGECSAAEQWAADTHIYNIANHFDLAVARGYTRIGFYAIDNAGHEELWAEYIPDFSMVTEWTNAFLHRAEIERLIGYHG